MKVFVFNGSRHRANSVCCMWIDQFMQLLKMSAPESIEFLSHGMENIQFCSGCQECFKTGMYLDRKSIRLNSSHLGISYAVFCLKKKKEGGRGGGGGGRYDECYSDL